MKNKKHDKQSVEKPDGGPNAVEPYLGPGLDGMGTGTAKLTIDKKLRKQLLQNYDLIELVNKGRYYAAKAYSKDSLWFYEMLIDKQSGSIQIVTQKRIDK